MAEDTPCALRVDDVDWEHWDAEIKATLVFVIQGDQILLIHKKTGIGQGKINGPGGKIEPGETPLACAIREVQEELLITPTGLNDAGLLHFQFTDGLSIFGHVFTASGYEGTPTETIEAKPIWCAVDQIPYDKMWADDIVWFPHMLAGKRFSGRFIFDGDRMLDIKVETNL